MRGSIGSISGRTIFESLLVVTLISTLIGGTGFEVQRIDRQVREVALRWELRNLRSAVALYSFMNSRMPRTLHEVLEKGYIEPFRRDVKLGHVRVEEFQLRLKHFISPQVIQEMGVDDEGNILDPFGNRYLFDVESGRLFTTTEGYESW